jgi:hypothetical protein
VTLGVDVKEMCKQMGEKELRREGREAEYVNK